MSSRSHPPRPAFALGLYVSVVCFLSRRYPDVIASNPTSIATSVVGITAILQRGRHASSQVHAWALTCASAVLSALERRPGPSPGASDADRVHHSGGASAGLAGFSGTAQALEALAVGCTRADAGDMSADANAKGQVAHLARELSREAAAAERAHAERCKAREAWANLWDVLVQISLPMYATAQWFGAVWSPGVLAAETLCRMMETRVVPTRLVVRHRAQLLGMSMFHDTVVVGGLDGSTTGRRGYRTLLWTAAFHLVAAVMRVAPLPPGPVVTPKRGNGNGNGNGNGMGIGRCSDRGKAAAQSSLDAVQCRRGQLAKWSLAWLAAELAAPSTTITRSAELASMGSHAFVACLSSLLAPVPVPVAVPVPVPVPQPASATPPTGHHLAAGSRAAGYPLSSSCQRHTAGCVPAPRVVAPALLDAIKPLPSTKPTFVQAAREMGLHWHAQSGDVVATQGQCATSFPTRSGPGDEYGVRPSTPLHAALEAATASSREGLGLVRLDVGLPLVCAVQWRDITPSERRTTSRSLAQFQRSVVAALESVLRDAGLLAPWVGVPQHTGTSSSSPSRGSHPRRRRHQSNRRSTNTNAAVGEEDGTAGGDDGGVDAVQQRQSEPLLVLRGFVVVRTLAALCCRMSTSPLGVHPKSFLGGKLLGACGTFLCCM